jgi:hypothetical protein
MTVVHEQPLVDAHEALDADTWNLLAEDVRKHRPDMTGDLADRGIGQMIAFLVAGTRTAVPLSPSRLVDDFWHAFILRTQAYAAFCERIAGRFIHHAPDLPRTVDEATKVTRRYETLEAIAAAGFTVAPELWPTASECSQCHAGCTDSPVGGGGQK